MRCDRPKSRMLDLSVGARKRFRLQVAMDHALACAAANPSATAATISMASRQVSTPRSMRWRRLADEQLGDDIRDATSDTDVVDRHHIGMRQRRHGLRFTLEARQRVAIVREVLGQHLDRDFALEPPVPRQAHFAHPTLAEWFEDLRGREECPDLAWTRLCNRISNGRSQVAAWLRPGPVVRQRSPCFSAPMSGAPLRSRR